VLSQQDVVRLLEDAIGLKYRAALGVAHRARPARRRNCSQKVSAYRRIVSSSIDQRRFGIPRRSSFTVARSFWSRFM
jgi:hypothetical protein